MRRRQQLALGNVLANRNAPHCPGISREMHSRRALLYFGLLFAVFSWAFNTVIVKYAVARVDPLAFTGLRFALMSPLAFLMASFLRQPVRFYARDLPLLIVCGACGYGLYQCLWIFGLAHTSAFASALLSSLSPVFTLVLVAAARLERVHFARWIGAGVALAGVAVFEGAFAGHATFRTGDALTILSAAIFAVFNVASSRLLDRYTPVGLVAITMTIGALIILPGAIPRMLHGEFQAFEPIDWGIFAFALIFPILLTYPLWSMGISRIGAARTSLFQFATPVIAGLLSAPLLHDRFAAHQLYGGAICIAGMIFAQILGRFSLSAIWAQRTIPLKR